MPHKRTDRHALPREDLHADLERYEGGIYLCAEEVRERELRVWPAHHHEPRVFDSRDRLAREKRHDYYSAAVFLALERLEEQLFIVSAEKRGPCVDLVRAVVAVHHRDLAASRRREDVDLRIVPLHGLVENHHREDRSSRRAVSGARRDGIRRDHAGSRVAFRRRHHGAWLKRPRRVEPLGSALRENARPFAGLEHLRKLLPERTAELRVERRKHARVVVSRLGIDREHSARLADAHYVLAGEPVMNVSGESREPPHIRDMRLFLQDRLAVVGDAPSLRHVEPEHLRKLRGGLGRHDVAPRAERDEELPVGVERKIPVHHAGNAERGEPGQFRAVPRERIGRALRVRVPHARFDLLERIAPHAVHKGVLPVVRALRHDVEIVVYKHRLDSC